VYILIILSQNHLLKFCGPTCYLDTVLSVDIPVTIILYINHKNKQNDSLQRNSTGHIALNTNISKLFRQFPALHHRIEEEL